MTRQINLGELHVEYENASEHVQNVVDHCVSNVMSILREEAFKASGDDRVEELTAAIFHYLKSCNPSDIGE